jgi:hypothetical protein
VVVWCVCITLAPVRPWVSPRLITRLTIKIFLVTALLLFKKKNTHNPDSSIGQSAELKFPRKKFETSLGCYKCVYQFGLNCSWPGSLNDRVDILIGKEPGCNPVVYDVGGSSPSLLNNWFCCIVIHVLT